jgi:hypothetical protein
MKVLKWLLIVTVVTPLLLVGGIYARNKAVGPDGWAMDNAVKELKSRMKDPDSMVIRSHYLVHKTSSDGDVQISLCGVVDAKNGFGGYTGGYRFVTVSMLTKNPDTFSTYNVALEDPKDLSLSRRMNVVSAFVKVYWNQYCVDSIHPMLGAEKGD